MTKYKTQIVLILLASQIFGCYRGHKAETKINQSKTDNILGTYSYCLKGEYPTLCEIPLHLLRLKRDSTFIIKLYCYGDSTSLLKSTFESGKWSKINDSSLNFVRLDKTTFKGKILLNGSIEIVNTNSKFDNPSYVKDTIDYGNF